MSRFKIKQAKTIPTHYIVEDTVTGLRCKFYPHRFNETQEFYNIPQGNPIQIPTLMRELGDWLAENHRDKLF